MNSCHCQFISILRPISRSHQMSDRPIYSQLDTRNLFKRFPALTYMLVSTSGTPSFAKESHGNELEKILPRYIWPRPNQSRPTADSRLPKPMRKFLNYLKTLGPCNQWGLSAPMKSVRQPMMSLQCRSSLEKPSGSNPDVTCAPWITSFQLTNLK